MKEYFFIFPISVLVTFSQLIVKSRASALPDSETQSFWSHLVKFLSDPVVLSAYAAALVASFAWLYVVTKLPLSIAFPVYIGLTFSMVLLGGYFFLGENLTPAKITAVALILAGIVLGVAVGD